MSQDKYESIAEARVNPNPVSNPKLREVCNGLKDVRNMIADELTLLYLKAPNYTKGDLKEIAELESLAEKAKDSFIKFGCSATHTISPLHKIIMDNLVATKS
jgi:hypothetical protein